MKIESELIQKLKFNLPKVIPTPEFNFQRILIWNTILRNSLLRSLNYIHIYIERFSDLLNPINKNERYYHYIKTISLKNKISKNDLKSCFKIRFLLDGLENPFVFKNFVLINEISENDLLKIQKELKYDIKNIAEKLNYKIEIFEINIISEKKFKHIQKIDIFIKENYIPLKWI